MTPTYLVTLLKVIIFISMSLTSYIAFAQYPESKIKEVASSKQWLKLMHYRQGTFGGWSSEVDGVEFFFSPHGKTDPIAELKSFLENFHSTKKFSKLKQPLHCAFPARFQFIANEFSLSLPQESCPLLEGFLSKFHNPKSLSVVFSSAYPNNPASMFGHTFVKINSERNTDLIDHGVNFAAYVSENENPLKFVWYGVNGGYFGQWSSQPYYVKVQEYNNFESRDLWEYELNLTPEETRKLIYHLWEIETNSHFFYYFFDKNCSYQILAALEAIKPEWNLTNYRLHMIPGESVKNLFSTPEVVKEVKFRPSLHKKLWQHYISLNSSEREDFDNIIENKTPPALSHSKLTLDTSALYLQYLKSDRPKIFEKKYSSTYASILSQRAQLGVLSEAEKSRLPMIPEDTRPEQGHDAYALSFTIGHLQPESTRSRSEFLGVKIKSAYHDLLNKDLGFNTYSHIDFPSIGGRYEFATGKFYINEATFLATTSLHPFTKLDKKISYKLDSGITSLNDDLCFQCRAVFAEGGLGITLSRYDFKTRWYNLLLLRLESMNKLPQGYRTGPGLESGLLMNPWPDYKMQLFTKLHWLRSELPRYSFHEQYGFRHSLTISRNLEIRQENLLTRSKSSPQELETLLSIISFFH